VTSPQIVQRVAVPWLGYARRPCRPRTADSGASAALFVPAFLWLARTGLLRIAILSDPARMPDVPALRHELSRAGPDPGNGGVLFVAAA
jgi:hypothetical protein